MANELEVRFSCEDAFRSDVDDIIKVYEAGRHVEKIQRWRQTLEDALFLSLSLSVCLSVCLLSGHVSSLFPSCGFRVIVVSLSVFFCSFESVYDYVCV